MNAPIAAETLRPWRPALRWYGGKWKLAPWIIGHFPPHRIYVEPFGGAASVLLRKARSYAEVYNDLDDEVVGLFRVLQDRDSADRLLELLRRTPFARREFEISGEACDEPIERARRLIIRSLMGFGSNAHASSTVSLKNGWRAHTIGTAVGRQTGFRANSNKSGTTPAHDWLNYPDALAATIERWSGVIVEHRDALVVMGQHDHAETLHYVDPPYLAETRSPSNKYDLKYRMYRHELDRGGHVALLGFLRTLAGMVVLSGYPAPLYDQALPGWRREEKQTHADGARPRTEVLWLNPACVAALERQARGAGMPLFGGGAE